jgi:hypothetical protein
MLSAPDPLRCVPLVASSSQTTDLVVVHSFKTVFGLSLHANGLVLENEDGDVKPGTTFGAQVAFNAATLTAVTTRALDAAGDDIVELLLEVDYRTFDPVNIVTKGAGEYHGLHLPPLLTVTLHSVLCPHCTDCDTYTRLCPPSAPTGNDSIDQDRDPIER